MSRSKKPSMADVLKNAASGLPQPPAPVVVEVEHPPLGTKTERAAKKSLKGRDGLKPIQGYFDPEIRKQLKRLAADEDSSVQELLGEALNDLFEKRGLDICIR